MYDLPEILLRGERARLIPITSDSSREQRVTSTVLSVLSAVDEFGHGLLRAVNAPVGKTSKIECLTEVVFKSQPLDKQYRPDGLIIVRTGGRVWTALVEAKIGNSQLDAQQVEKYVDIARSVGTNAVITISNQFASLQTHHPISINKNKLRSIGLYHWSWTAILTEALLYESGKGIADPDQAFILREMIRYLQHDSSGVSSYDRMPKFWRDICSNVQQGVQLTRSTSGIIDAVEGWHEFTRFLALDLSVALGRTVTIYLSRSHAGDPSRRLHDDIKRLISDSLLEVQFDVPDAASRIMYTADLARRTLTASMTLKAPRDRKRARSHCTWIYRQVQSCPDDGTIVVAKWPRRTRGSSATLGQMRENRNVLIGSQTDRLVPVAFDVRQVCTLGARFKGPRTFVEDALAALPLFYENVGQHLQAWVPKPPQIKQKSGSEAPNSEEVDQEEIGEETEEQLNLERELEVDGAASATEKKTRHFFRIGSSRSSFS